MTTSIERVRGTNATELTAGDVTVLFSYSTPVIYHESGSRPRITATRYSVTTSRHINEWLRRHDFDRDRCETIPQTELDSLANLSVGHND